MLSPCCWPAESCSRISTPAARQWSGRLLRPTGTPRNQYCEAPAGRLSDLIRDCQQHRVGIFRPFPSERFVPVVLLMHEFTPYTQPKSTMRQAIDWATEIVFSANIVAQSAREEHPRLLHRAVHILPQGQCDPPTQPDTALGASRDLREVFRPPGMENALVVLGCGYVHIRKGVDLFLSCAAAVVGATTRTPCSFSCGLATDTLLNTTQTIPATSPRPDSALGT